MGTAPLILLDAQALIALLGDEPAAGTVAGLLDKGDAAITSVNLVETVDVLARKHGVPVERGRQAVEVLLGGGLGCVPVDTRVAWRAAELRSGHYHRTRCPLSLADSVLIAVATDKDVIASADASVIAVATKEGIRTIPLTDSESRRP